jgi:hypothetical protein
MWGIDQPSGAPRNVPGATAVGNIFTRRPRSRAALPSRRSRAQPRLLCGFMFSQWAFPSLCGVQRVMSKLPTCASGNIRSVVPWFSQFHLVQTSPLKMSYSNSKPPLFQSNVVQARRPLLTPLYNGTCNDLFNPSHTESHHGHQRHQRHQWGQNQHHQQQVRPPLYPARHRPDGPLDATPTPRDPQLANQTPARFLPRGRAHAGRVGAGRELCEFYRAGVQEEPERGMESMRCLGCGVVRTDLFIQFLLYQWLILSMQSRR